MIKRWFSNFLKINKGKFRDLGVKLIIVAIVVFIATIVLSFSKNDNVNKENEIKNVYKPQEAIIKGSNISEKQYVTDKNTVNQFLEYCNNKKIEEAYALISDECKNSLYPTIDIFKSNYYDYIFKENRQYNLQAWISTNKYTIYKIRYTTNMLVTGKYNENNTFQDYITLIKEDNEPKISIGNFILAEENNKETETKEIKARVIKKMVYIEDEEYEIEIRNKTQNPILLDNLNSNYNISLIDKEGQTYRAYINGIFKQDMKIMPQTTKRIKIKFKKACSSEKKSEYIQFSKVIRNYDDYKNNEEEYTDIFNFRIRL